MKILHNNIETRTNIITQCLFEWGNENFIGIHARNKCQWIGCLKELEIQRQNYGGLKLLGDSNPNG
jgi:hypothetical protein